jgi:hypothetical protein
MHVWFSAAAEDQLDRLPKYLQTRILSKIELYAGQPDPLQLPSHYPAQTSIASALGITV